MSNVSKKELIIDRIDYFLTLKDNWDGYDAVPPSDEIATNAKKLINYIPISLFEYFDDGYPNTNGTICFEWKKDGDDLFIEIGNKSCSYILFQDEVPLLSEKDFPISIMTFGILRELIEQISE